MGSLRVKPLSSGPFGPKSVRSLPPMWWVSYNMYYYIIGNKRNMIQSTWHFAFIDFYLQIYTIFLFWVNNTRNTEIFTLTFTLTLIWPYRIIKILVSVGRLSKQLGFSLEEAQKFNLTLIRFCRACADPGKPWQLLKHLLSAAPDKVLRGPHGPRTFLFRIKQSAKEQHFVPPFLLLCFLFYACHPILHVHSSYEAWIFKRTGSAVSWKIQ